jgi:hypothetical protein
MIGETVKEQLAILQEKRSTQLELPHAGLNLPMSRQTLLNMMMMVLAG